MSDIQASPSSSWPDSCWPKAKVYRGGYDTAPIYEVFVVPTCGEEDEPWVGDVNIATVTPVLETEGEAGYRVAWSKIPSCVGVEFRTNLACGPLHMIQAYFQAVVLGTADDEQPLPWVRAVQRLAHKLDRKLLEEAA